MHLSMQTMAADLAARFWPWVISVYTAQSLNVVFGHMRAEKREIQSGDVSTVRLYCCLCSSDLGLGNYSLKCSNLRWILRWYLAPSDPKIKHKLNTGECNKDIFLRAKFNLDAFKHHFFFYMKCYAWSCISREDSLFLSLCMLFFLMIFSFLLVYLCFWRD